MQTISSNRFTTEAGHTLCVQVPEPHASEILDAITQKCTLKYGDYDRVSFQSSLGVQRFRSLPSGHNPATKTVVEVPCLELCVFIPEDQDLAAIIECVYTAHPYEEPVVQFSPAQRSLHIQGLDEDNPNRFWNRPAQDWTPAEHK